MLTVETWPVARLIPYARNPRKNDAIVDRMCGAIHEFGFRIPIIARSDGTVVDGHLRLTLRTMIRVDPAGPGEPGYAADLRLVLQAKDAPVTSERAIVWDIHQVYLKYGGPVMMAGKERPG